MKKFILGMIAITMLAACNETGTNPNTDPSGAVKDGGISSGGGGTLPADPASIFEIRDYIKDAKRDLRLYFRNQKYGLEDGRPTTSLDKKLFLGNKSLIEILETTGLELRMSKPCLDSAGKEVDGSIYASTPDTICISAYRIAPKTPKELARNEVLGLIAHELSHLLGSTEDEAVQFQQETIFALKYFKVDENTARYMTDEAQQSVGNLAASLKNIAENGTQLSDEELRKEFGETVRHLSDFESKSSILPFRFYTKPQEDYLNIQAARFRVALWYVEGLMNDAGGRYWKEKLDEAFGQNTEINYIEFSKNVFGSKDETTAWPEEMIQRPQSKQEVFAIATQLRKYFYEQSEYTWKFKINFPLSKLLVGPWHQPTTNPWEKFIGEYTIVDYQCQQDGYRNDPLYVIGFQIYRPFSGSSELQLKEINQNGYSHSGLEDNSSGVLAGSTVSVTGTPTTASRIAEAGNTWNERWSKQVDSLEATSNGFVWDMRIDSKDGNSDKKSFRHCRLNVQKK